MSYLFPVTKIQKFCTHDGPGIRTTVFLKGCPLRCQWCHNPETQQSKPQYFFNPSQCILCSACFSACTQGVHVLENHVHTLHSNHCSGCMQCTACCPTGALEACQTFLSAEDILTKVCQDKAFYGKSGGITLSGGEPMFHKAETVRLLSLCKQEKLHTVLETCGCFDAALLPSLIPVTDLFLWDIKDTNAGRHKVFTGADTDAIHSNLLIADRLGAKTILRCIMVKGVNMEESHFAGIAALYQKLHHCLGVELLPYHAYGDSKTLHLGNAPSAHPEWIPHDQDMLQAKKQLRPYVKLL